MKKLLAILMLLALVLTAAACAADTSDPPETETPTIEATPDTNTPELTPEPDNAAGVMTYAEYIAAPLDSAVVIEAYVQAKQSWWADQATIYTQDEDGAYFLYNAACSEADYALLVPGTKIQVTGFKAAWSGEVEIIDATFEIIGGSYVAPALDVSALLGTDALIEHQNEFFTVKGLTVEAAEDGSAFRYNWDGSGAPGGDSDLYFDVSLNGTTYTFVVEYYLANETTDVYQAVQALKAGDVIDVEGFLYWYEGVQPHITSVAAAV